MKNIDRITRWLPAYKSFQPKQVVQEPEAFKNDANSWMMRNPKAPVTNLEWLEAEQSRMEKKRIKTKIIFKGNISNKEAALFREEDHYE